VDYLSTLKRQRIRKRIEKGKREQATEASSSRAVI
jgi:hypothetical protein